MSAGKENNLEYLKTEYQDSTNLISRISLHDRFSTNPYGWARWVFDQLRLQPDREILELGCGTGGLWKGNLERIPKGSRILLTDFSDGMLKDTKKNLSGKRTFSFKVLDANEKPLPFENASFDTVIANHMLYYVTDRQELFSEINRILKPGGHFYASTIGKQHLVEITNLLNTFDPALASFWESTSGIFTLENGKVQLFPWFNNISLRVYEDSLKVTEIEPLVDYIRSGLIGRFPEDRLDELKALIKRVMDFHHGAINITKSSGIFEAVRK